MHPMPLYSLGERYRYSSPRPQLGESRVSGSDY
ncbi:hypothetical protein RSAG8_05950, partial [Rhizoctonia solani AG-8 WAC10335]